MYGHSSKFTCLKIVDTLSEVVRYGIPQGSVLSENLVHNFYKNLRQWNFSGKLSSFADDTALCHVEYVGRSYRAIVEDLNAIKLWFVLTI